MGSDEFFFAICRVLDLYNCCNLVSGVQHPAMLQEMIYSLLNFSPFLTEIFPHQQVSPKVIILFIN